MHIFSVIILLSLFVWVNNGQAMEVPHKTPTDVNDQKKIQLTPLYLANAAGDYGLAESLIAQGARLTVKSEYQRVQRYASLIFALYHANLDFFNYILEEEKIDINRQDSRTGFTILHDVGMGWVFKVLKNQGYQPKFVENLSHKDLIVFLLSKGANPFIKNDIKHFPYEYVKSKEIRNILKTKEAAEKAVIDYTSKKVNVVNIFQKAARKAIIESTFRQTNSINVLRNRELTGNYKLLNYK